LPTPHIVHCRQSALSGVIKLWFLLSTRTSERSDPGDAPYAKTLAKIVNQHTMKQLYIFWTIFLSVINTISGQQCDSCKLQFDKLLYTLNQEKVSKIDLDKCWQITKKLHTLKYTDYIDSVANNSLYVSHSLTKTFSDICIKSNNNLGVDYYLKYMALTHGSAEEERAYALERLLVKYPEILLINIGTDKDLLNDLIWGFLNNRYYGAKNPLENWDYTAKRFNDSYPKPILNKENCKNIFFEAHPTLKDKYSSYKYQLDFIINGAIEYLSEENE